jgi:hypothetical protein
VTVEVNDGPLKAMRAAPELAESALQSGADFWHKKILPRHFEKKAHDVYGYARRAINYLKNRAKGQKPDLVFSGGMRRELGGFAAFRKSGKTLELKMTARALNFAPRMNENDESLYVQHKNGRGYPNLKREIKAITDDERAEVAEVVTGVLGDAMNVREGSD